MYGCQSMVDPLRTVLVRRPDDAFGSADPELWHYTAPPQLEEARYEHDGLVRILREADAEVLYHDDSGTESADAIFTHDPCIVTDAGAVILRMGKSLRRGETAAMERELVRFGIPILGRLDGTARAEGGDLLWLDHDTLLVGQGLRTNAEGRRQLERMLAPLGVRLVPVPLPDGDPDGCLHLMSFVSLLDRDLAVVYPPMLPAVLRDLLTARGYRLVEVPAGELPTMGPNVLALAPRRCLMLEGSPITRRRLEDVGCSVRTYEGDEISLRAEGGPTCLTRPTLRRR